VEKVYALAEARGVARRWVELQPGADHLVRMEEGVTLSGRLEKLGQPVPNLVVGVSTTDRTCGEFFHGDEVATDKNGVFLLPNIPPHREFVFFVKMDSAAGQGMLEPKILRTGTNGQHLKLGTLQLQPGYRVAGRVVLADNKPVPPGTHLSLGREQAWDQAQAVVDSDGSFAFEGVATEAISLSTRVKGYKYSKRNLSLDWLNGGLVGRVTGNLTNLTLLLEPGEWRYNGKEGEPPGGVSQPRDQPLRGSK
jgi:hypothetical protein